MNRHFPPKKRSSKGGGATDGSGKGRKKILSVCQQEEEEEEEEEDENEVLRSRLIMLDNSCWEPMRAVHSNKMPTSAQAVSAHPCTQCHKSFSSAGKLHQHTFVHTGERPFRCHECDKGFSSRFKLMRHALIHSNERRYKCSYCERCFHRKDHLKNHLQVHNPNKKVYKCEECLKEYNSRLSYRKHVAFHAAESGDLECKVCGKRFASTEEILYHLKVHTGSRAVKSPNEKKFKCEFCERRFFTRKDVKRHLVVHTGRRDFLCQFCPQKFGRKDHLVRHIKKSHNNASSTVNNDTSALKLNESIIRHHHHHETFHFTSPTHSLTPTGYTLADEIENRMQQTQYMDDEKQIKNEFLDNSSSSLAQPPSPSSMYLLSASSYSAHVPSTQLHELDGLEYAKMYDQVIKREKGEDNVDENEEDTLVNEIDISQLLEFMPYTNSPSVITPTAAINISASGNVGPTTSHVTLDTTSHFLSGTVTPLPQFNQAFQ